MKRTPLHIRAKSGERIAAIATRNACFVQFLGTYEAPLQAGDIETLKEVWEAAWNAAAAHYVKVLATSFE